MKYSIHYFQRKRRDGKNFSLEQIFEDLREKLKNNYEVKHIESPFISSGVLRRLINIFYAAFDQGDINHVTGDINYVNLLQSKSKNVLTILDCGVLERVTGIKKKVLELFWFKIPVRRASVVTVISEATKSHLLKVVNCRADKIKVIYVPISNEFKKVLKDFRTDKPRILQIGSAPNKNLKSLIEAVKGLSCELAIIGEISLDNLSLLKEYNVAYENYIGIPFNRVIEEYAKCDILFFASTFEGFGMPILEAQATGRPVITSNLLSMPEVGGDAAHYVDPYDIEDIKVGIKKIIDNKLYRDELVSTGFKNILRFDADKIAKQYKEVYQEILM